jgi:PIN domain nuclease of toxin-antitoxin system
MKVLIDTHVLIWWAGDTNQLSPLVRDMLADPQTEPILSIVSIWEMQIKISLGKLSLQMDLPTLVEDEVSRNIFSLLPIELKHIYGLNDLPLHHKDPFDRLLIAQSMLEKMPIISIDEKFDAYGVQRLW